VPDRRDMLGVHGFRSFDKRETRFLKETGFLAGG
jgi:hypothetical protein